MATLTHLIEYRGKRTRPSREFTTPLAEVTSYSPAQKSPHSARLILTFKEQLSNGGFKEYKLLLSQSECLAIQRALTGHVNGNGAGHDDEQT